MRQLTATIEKSINIKVLAEQERTGQECKNYRLVLVEFYQLGVPVKQINPSANVLTYKKWIDKGRQVRKGEHGVKIVVMIQDKKNAKKKFPRTTSVFHISQTDPITI